MAKDLPKQLQTRSDKINRGRQISRTDDNVRSKSIGILDIDQALFYYFENVIKPTIEENGEQVKVPVIYANPERWAAIQRQGHIRDNKRKIMTPVISFRRTSLAKDESVPVDKLDPSSPKLFQSYQSRYTQENRYDKLTALKGISPKKEMFNVAVPDYVTLSYDFIIWTNFTDQMNKIVETINWSEGSYWGEPGKFRFRATIDSFEDSSEYDESRRNIKTNFSVTLKGYLVPDSFNNLLTTQKFITPKQVVITDNTDINILPITDIGDDGERSIRVVTNLGGTGGGGGGGGSVQSLTLTAGPNMAFDSFIYTGVTPLNKTIKISDTPSFSTLTVTSSAAITGSMNVSASATSSTAIFATNVQNGYPTSNAWQEGLDGSYFDNFDNTTHVSEILRFMAGIISHSLDTASPTQNTKTFGSVSISYAGGGTTSKGALLNGVLGTTYENARLSNSWTGSSFIDLAETGSYRAVQDYLELKGWVQSSDRGTGDNDVGTNPFHGSYASRIPGTILQNAQFSNLAFTFTANAAGSTSVSSNGNYFGLGPLLNGGPRPYYVKVIASQSFSDSYSDSTPDASSTFHRKAENVYTQSAFGTSGDGLILAKIPSSQPAVIPSAFQDGDFNSVDGPLTGRQYTGGATNKNTVSASGYYKMHDVKVGLMTGSMTDFTFNNGTDESTLFYLYTGDLPSDITTGAPTAVVSQQLTRTSFSATSRSLSGAPYLLTTSYAFTFNSEVSKSFDPAFGYGTSVLVNSISTDGWETPGSTTITNTTTTVNNTGVSSTGATNYIWDRTKTTKRTSGQSPQIHDIAVASSSMTFTLDSNTHNVGQNRTANNTLNYNMVFRARGRNWKNSSVDSTSSTVSFYDATLFGQHANSGSMAIYSRAQNYDSNTLQDTSETFTGESNRIQLLDNVQAFNGTAFVVNSFQTNDEGDAVLGNYDLQVKPGYLVDPGGSYGYWFASGFGSGTYKYYIRRFRASSGTKSSMTVNVGKSLVAWNATTNGISVAILFKSSGNGSGNRGGAGALGTARIFDPTATTSNLIEANIANDNFKNPFSTAINLYGNTGGSVSGNTYSIPLRNADSMFIDNTDNELYVIIRYKGDPAPVTSINLSYS